MLIAGFVFINGCSPTEPTNIAPAEPFDPSPMNDAPNQPINVNLAWSCSDPDDDNLKYDVYFGTLDNPPLVNQNQEQNIFFNPRNLAYREVYHWKIVAKDNHGHSVESQIWTFTTSGECDFKLTENVTISMVWIPAGSFMMGAQDHQRGINPTEDPRHEVNIPNGFWMGKYEVTQSQWEAVTGSNPSNYDGHYHPVEQVSWDDIHDFLEQIADGFRLPSEAEWEYACRAGTDTRFYWGDYPNYDYAWYVDNSIGRTHQVGAKKHNAWELHDISGNVWEWCEDRWHSDYWDAPDNGSPWLDNGVGSSRVFRGGSWCNNDRS